MSETKADFSQYSPPKWCAYPFENDPLGYCWSWANHIDGQRKEFEKARDGFCKGCELNKDES